MTLYRRSYADIADIPYYLIDHFFIAEPYKQSMG